MGSQISRCVGHHCGNDFPEEGDFLPGLPDEITVDLILTKLHWRDLYVLASLNRAWQAALKRREVLDARIRAKSTTTLVSMIHYGRPQKFMSYVNVLSLYDSSTNSWHLLPSIPDLVSIPDECCCVSSRGRLYVIGGKGERMKLRAEVHAFDLVGVTGWKRCASMITPRSAFACEVKDGKVYVFGGIGARGASEVYDPERNVWNAIAPMLSFQVHHKVAIVGGKFFFAQLGKIHVRGSYTKFTEIYDPRTNQWKLEDVNFNNSKTLSLTEAMVATNGTVRKILDRVLLAYDEPSRSWKELQHVSWDVFCGRRFSFSDGASAVVVNGELVTLMYEFGTGRGMCFTTLMSEGLGIKNRPLSWKRIDNDARLAPFHTMCTIDL